MNGYIYAIELPSGLIKIGFTKMIGERVLAHRRQYGPDIKLLGAVWGMAGQETDLLQLLRPYRVKGELFAPVKAVLHAVSGPRCSRSTSAPAQRRAGHLEHALGNPTGYRGGATSQSSSSGASKNSSGAEIENETTTHRADGRSDTNLRRMGARVAALSHVQNKKPGLVPFVEPAKAHRALAGRDCSGLRGPKPRRCWLSFSAANTAGIGDTIQATMHRVELKTGIPYSISGRVRNRQMSDMLVSNYFVIKEAYDAALAKDAGLNETNSRAYRVATFLVRETDGAVE